MLFVLLFLIWPFEYTTLEVYDSLFKTSTEFTVIGSIWVDGNVLYQKDEYGYAVYELKKKGTYREEGKEIFWAEGYALEPHYDTSTVQVKVVWRDGQQLYASKNYKYKSNVIFYYR